MTNGVSTIRYKSSDGLAIGGDVVCDITVRFIHDRNDKYAIRVNGKPIGSLPYANQPHRIHKQFYTYRYQFRDAVYYEFEIVNADGNRMNNLFIDSIRIERYK